jgi:hypothetical protein
MVRCRAVMLFKFAPSAVASPGQFLPVQEKGHVTACFKRSFFWFCLHERRNEFHMKRIALLVCGMGMVLLVANSAQARGWRWNRGNSNSYTYSQPAQVAQPAPVAPAVEPTTAVQAKAALSTDTESGEVKQVSYSTSTAQGVANLMASYNRVGHFGGNPGYEGCGCGATPQAAYSICCYGNSGMATVDVGYAKSASGMWYCCRRYR